MKNFPYWLAVCWTAAAQVGPPPAGFCPGSAASVARRIESEYPVARGGPSGAFRTGQPADLMLSGFGFNRSGGPLQFRYNSGIASDGTRLILADRGNNRVLIWHELPSSNRPPDLVLGQKDFETNEEGSGRSEFNWPLSVATDGRRLVVADANNDRLLIWSEFPTRNGQPADIEISIQWPWGVWTDGEKLVATSTTPGRHARVWTRFPTRDNEPASFLLHARGDFGTPRSITSDGKYLIIGDHNAKVSERGPGNYVWKTFPTAEDAPYDYFLSDPREPGAAWLQGKFLPDGRLAMLGRSLYLWNSPPESAAAPPSFTMNRFDFTAGDASDMVYAGGRLYVSAANSNRVLVYDGVPETERPPDFALGSDDICVNTLDANYIVTNPVPTTDGTRLFVSSDFDRKLYVWRNIPDSDGAKPDLVYSFPDQVWQHAQHGDTLVAAGKRSLFVWRRLPVEGQPPDVTLRDQIGNVRLQEVQGVAYDGRRLFVSDRMARRIYVWDGIPEPGANPTHSIEADQVTRLHSDGTWLVAARTEGQSILVYRIAELDAPPRTITEAARRRINLPQHATIQQGKLIVCDTNNSRVVVWASVEDALAGREPLAIIGSRDSKPSVKADGMYWPGAAAFDGSYLWVGEFKFSGRLRRYSVE